MSEPNREILIVKNPIFFRSLCEEAFSELIKDGSWIPLVFNAIEKVVNEHFFDLCELNWDYLREVSSQSHLSNYGVYKSIYYIGLDDSQIDFVKKVADEIEEEVKLSANEALQAAKEEQE